MVMAGGERGGRLTDLSQNGARLETDQPPAAGTTGFLRWGSEEHYCKVIWSGEGRCGLQFDRSITLAAVEASSSRIEVSLKPIAALGRIPLGQKRSRVGPVVASEPAAG